MMYLPIAKRVYHEFTEPILNLINNDEASPGPKMVDETNINWRKMNQKWAKTTGVSGQPCLNGAVCADKDDYDRGPWCKTAKMDKEECYDTDISSLPKSLFVTDCVSPCGKWGDWDSWCMKKKSNMPYGGTWGYC